MGDKLYFYATGRSPDERTTGLATLRRDGFASLDAGTQTGTLVTRPVVFQGRHFFVNLDADAGEMRVEILSRGGQPIPPFTRENCLPLRVDSTLQAVRWQGAADLSQLEGCSRSFSHVNQFSTMTMRRASPPSSGSERSTNRVPISRSSSRVSAKTGADADGGRIPTSYRLKSALRSVTRNPPPTSNVADIAL